jgi:Zn-finger nucleic acid-binding protein
LLHSQLNSKAGHRKRNEPWTEESVPGLFYWLQLFISIGEAIMNFMSEMDGLAIQVELKYCERCGGLWLRRLGTDGVHCAPCQSLLAAKPSPEDPPVPKPRRRKARMKGKRARRILKAPAGIDYLECAAAIEVWA